MLDRHCKVSMDNNSMRYNNHNKKMKGAEDEEQLNMKKYYNNLSMDLLVDTMDDYPLLLESTIHEYNDTNFDMEYP